MEYAQSGPEELVTAAFLRPRAGPAPAPCAGGGGPGQPGERGGRLLRQGEEGRGGAAVHPGESSAQGGAGTEGMEAQGMEVGGSSLYLSLVSSLWGLLKSKCFHR